MVKTYSVQQHIRWHIQDIRPIFNISNRINVFSLSIITLSIIILLINCNIKLPLQKKWDFIWNSSFTLLYVVELSKYLFKWMNTFSVLHLHICCTINQSYSKNSRNISCLRWLMVGISCIQTRLPQTSKNYVTMFSIFVVMSRVIIFL